MTQCATLARPCCRASFSRQFLLNQWPSQFLFLFFISPALFFLLQFFLAQLHFYFVCPLYTLHLSPYTHLQCFQSFLPFRRSVQVFAPTPLHYRKKRIFCCPLEKELRKRLVKCFVWSVVLYGTENWTLGRSEQK